MPVTPRTWSPGDPVSPTYLNTDLYAFSNASPLCPNGVQFHARKPLYRCTAAINTSIAALTWGYAFAGQMTAHIVQDSVADYGNALDPPQWGTVQSTLPGADGNPGDAGGGWFLVSGFVPIGNAGSNGVPFGADFGAGGTVTLNVGQYVTAQSGHPATPWTCDLVNAAPGTTLTLTVFNGDSTTKSTIINTEGNGITPYFQAQWASTGGTVTPPAYPPAPKTSWAAGDQWTAAWANGPAGIASVLEYLNNPPCLRADTGGGTTSVPSSTATVIAVNTAQLDAWRAFSTSTHTWTCPADGLYFCYGRVAWNNAAGSFAASLRVNGSDFFGPSNHGGGGGGGVFSTACKAQIMSLQAGDTVQLAGYQTSGSTLSTRSDDPSRLVIVWAGSPGAPGVLNANPYFSGGSTTSWAGFGGTITPLQPAPAGCPYPQALLFQPSATQAGASAEESATPFAVTAGNWYGVSSWVQPAGGTTQILLGFDWQNSGHSFLSTSAATFPPNAGTWSWVHTLQQAPSGASFAYARAGRSNGTIAIGTADSLRIAGVQAGQAGSGQPAPPDLAYRYAAGTPGGSVPAVFSSNLGNDLTFLTQRPCLLAYQTSGQAVVNGSATALTLNNVAGQIHGDYGDNYGGWNAAASNYISQAAGWYLVVLEAFVTVNTSASFPAVIAQIQVSAGPGPDNYEEHVVTVFNDGTIPGATAIGYYYLRPGDYVFGRVTISNYPAPANTSVAGNQKSHLEVIWVSE